MVQQSSTRARASATRIARSSTWSPSRSPSSPASSSQLAGRDTGAAVPWAYGIVGLVHQAGDWWVDDQTMSRERFLAYLVDLLWDGLAGTAGH